MSIERAKGLAYEQHVKDRGGPAVPRLEWECGWEAAVKHMRSIIAHAVHRNHIAPSGCDACEDVDTLLNWDAR